MKRIFTFSSIARCPLHFKSMVKERTHHPEPAGENIYNPEDWFKQRIGHKIRVTERVVADRLEDEFHVAERIFQSLRQTDATAPGAAPRPSQQQVNDTGAQPHGDLTG